jgi:acetyl-CoA carboxylase beta subunit
MTVIIAYAVFTCERDEEEGISTDEHEVLVNDFGDRYVTLSCQTCRKLKRHREIRPNVFQCTKCKRHVDISKS